MFDPEDSEISEAFLFNIMPKKLTLEEFLKKLLDTNEHYRNGEFKIISEYVNYTTPIIAEDCFGKCKMDYQGLTSRNSTTSVLTAIDKTNYFSNELLKHNLYYKNEDFKIIGEYRGRLYKIKILNKYGICNVNAESLIKGSEPTILSAVNKEDYFSEILKEKNPKIYNLVNVIKYHSFSKIIVDCEFGRLITSADGILEWEELSIKSAVNKTDFWIKRSVKTRIDSDNIDYSKVIYTDNKNNVDLSCKRHNYKYTQRPSHHMVNIQGCPYCMKQVVMYNNTTIISHKEFIEDIKGFTYVLKLYNNDEMFYKVGIVSKHRLEYRLTQLRKTYKVFVEYLEESDMVSAYKLEQSFLEEFKKYKYIPKIKFVGYTECLTINPIEAYYWWEQQKSKSNYESENQEFRY